MPRRGFTIMELIIAIVVGGILLTIAVAGFGAIQSRTSARQARNVFAGIHARARAHAIEFGATTLFEIDTSGDSIWISRNDTTLERVRLGEEFGVDLRGASARYTLCMSPRGYGDTGCTSFTTAVTFTFQQAGESMTATLLPLGQLELPGAR